MTFIEGDNVVYDNFFGVIDFIGSSYIVIAIDGKSSSPARLLVYQENYKMIQILTK